MDFTRRGFMASAAVGVAASLHGTPAAAQSGRTLLKGGCVLSLDPKVGDFDTADVLIEGGKIAAVQPNITATAQVIDAANMIVMPGFVDTHRHMWQGAVRNSLPNGLLGDYVRDILGSVRGVMRPEDVRIGDLVSALGAINAGVTTLLDWSHIGSSPAHTDAAIQGLRESGVRAVYAFGGGAGGPANRYPDDIRRLRKQYFSSSDQLLTLAMASGLSAGEWAVAREVGASISVHANGNLPAWRSQSVPTSPISTATRSPSGPGRWWPTREATSRSPARSRWRWATAFRRFSRRSTTDSAPSLSVDVETQMPGDFFTQMRAVFTLQRMQALARQRANDANAPTLLTVRDVIEFATISGARANRLDRKIGTLTPGKDADIIMLRTDAINVAPMNNAYAAVVQAMDTSNVDTVFIAGQLRKRQGQLVGSRSESHPPAGAGVARLHRAESRLASSRLGRS